MTNFDQNMDNFNSNAQFKKKTCFARKFSEGSDNKTGFYPPLWYNAIYKKRNE
jgi:hypothetical protein